MKTLYALAIAAAAFATPALATDLSEAGIPASLQAGQASITQVSGFTGVTPSVEAVAMGDISEGGLPAVLSKSAPAEAFAFRAVNGNFTAAMGDVSEAGIPASLR